ncbi:MAG: trimethylamine methyltransferase family protein, partial [Candidatus Latescibacteria bacterium]|nr:trimethylamine methyltransferase family protein [Candidatus Latescibacterota bacterium]
MSRLFGKIKVLTDTEMQLVHNTALDILEQIGMKIYHSEARKILREYGCQVNEKSLMVKFPYDLVENSVKKMRKDFVRPERAGLKQAIRYGEVSYYKRNEDLHQNFTCNSGGFCTFTLDLEGRRRKATMDDLHNGLKLVNVLDDITYSGLP